MLSEEHRLEALSEVGVRSKYVSGTEGHQEMALELAVYEQAPISDLVADDRPKDRKAATGRGDLQRLVVGWSPASVGTPALFISAVTLSGSDRHLWIGAVCPAASPMIDH